MPTKQTASLVPLSQLIKSSAERSEKLVKRSLESSAKEVHSSAEGSEKEVNSLAERSEKKVKSSVERREEKVKNSAERSEKIVLRRQETGDMVTYSSLNAARNAARKEHLWVSPGPLGLKLKIAEADSTNGCGAEITKVDPRCSFKEQVAIGDRIVTVDDKKVTSMEDVKANKDKVRKLGIVKRPRSVLEAEQTNPKSTKKAKGNGRPAKKAKGVIDLTKKDAEDENPARTANGSGNPGPPHYYPSRHRHHAYPTPPHPPFPPTVYPHGYVIQHPGDAPYGHYPAHVPHPAMVAHPVPPAPFPQAGGHPGLPGFPHLSAMGLTVNDPYARRRRRDLLSELLRYNRLADIRTVARMGDGKHYEVDVGDERPFDEAEEAAAMRERGVEQPSEERFEYENYPGYHALPTYTPGTTWNVSAGAKKEGSKHPTITYHKVKPLPPGTPRKGAWTDEEDKIIRKHMQQHKETWGDEYPFTNWTSLANELKGRAGKQVRDRWTNYLHPAIDRQPFDRGDDLKLWEAFRRNPKRWKEISVAHFRGARSENQVKNRWNSVAFKKFVALEFGRDAYKVQNAKEFGPIDDAPGVPANDVSPEPAEGDGEEEGGAKKQTTEEGGSDVRKTLEETSEEEENQPAEKEVMEMSEEGENQPDEEEADTAEPGGLLVV